MDSPIGTDADVAYPSDGEQPARIAHVPAFDIAATTVTVAQFAAFIDATGYVTDAERLGTSFVYAGLMSPDAPPTRGVAVAPWWREVLGASWKHPTGPSSHVVDLGDHPVVHVSHNDAVAYCDWSGTRLPTELEWERAARDGATSTFPWGDHLEPDGRHMMNVFQGSFPEANSGADGYLGTAPVRSFPPTDAGMYEVCGNVWELTSSAFEERLESATTLHGTQPGDTPVSIRGGSYMCHDSYCHRYRLSARSSTTADSSIGHMGFRVARQSP
jgi:formylglycine-generating enzyme required for sulfatase activity